MALCKQGHRCIQCIFLLAQKLPASLAKNLFGLVWYAGKQYEEPVVLENETPHFRYRSERTEAG